MNSVSQSNSSRTDYLSTRPVVSKGWNIALWVLQIVAATAFLAAGGAKLSGNPMMVGMFQKIGFGQWFRYVTGAIEVLSAILLLIPKTVFYGASLLVCTMVGAILTHLFLVGGNPAPPIMLLVIVATIAWKRWPMRG